MAGNPISSLLQVILPKKKPNKVGVSDPPTYNRASPETVLSVPTYRDHLTSIFDSRVANDSRTLIKSLAKHDSDMSAAFHAYQSVANTDHWFIVYDENNEVSEEGMQLADAILASLSRRFDYTKPGNFAYKPSLKTLFTDMRYMLMLRGGIGAELILNERLLPDTIRLVDMATVEWSEPQPGRKMPEQVVSGTRISLDIPTFFVSYYRKDPTEAYGYSPFVSAINVISARQQVIDNLYRIMIYTGFPRIHIKVVEEVLRKSAPADCKTDENKMRQFVADRMAEISAQVTTMRADTAFVAFDSVEPGVFNEKNPAASLDITSVIKTLNEQNQAALKVMGTVIGRGESGVNTASVEARIFSMQAESMNEPIAEIMGHMLTLALRLNGFMGHVEFGFDHVDLRPPLELEAHLTMRQARMLELLSLGVISDTDFHIEMFGKPKPQGAKDLSGTGFMSKTSGASDTSQPNSMDRSASAPDSKSASSKTVKKPTGQ